MKQKYVWGINQKNYISYLRWIFIIRQFIRLLRLKQYIQQINNKRMKIHQFLCLVYLLVQNIQALSNPLVNPSNTKFQAGQTSIINAGGNLNTTIQGFTFLYVNAMPTVSLKAMIGINSIQMNLEDEVFGFQIVIFSFDSNSMSIQAFSRTDVNPVTLLRLIYMVTSYDQLHIGYSKITFNPSTDSIANGSLPDSTVCAVYCKSKGVSLPYPSIGNTKKAAAFFSGFAVDEFQPGIGPDPVFGLGLNNLSPGTTDLSLNVVVFGKALLTSISIRYLSFQLQSLNILGDKIILQGSSSAGCFYTWTGCNSTTDPITINNTIWTANTGFSTYYNTAHFYGLSFFVQGYDSSPAYSLGFNVISVNQSSGTYKTLFSYTGNADGKFGVAYSYLIILQFYCPSVGTDIYYVYGLNKCDSNCNNTIGQYWDVDRKCKLCDPICYKCSGQSFLCDQCYTTGHNRVLSGDDCICNPVGYYDDNSSLVCPKCHYSCRTCTGPSASQCIDCTNTSFRSIILNSCVCNVRYWDNPSNIICANCHYTCYTCSAGSSTSCLSCSTAIDYRQINSTANTCPCMIGYYNIGTSPVCGVCHYSCWTCSTNTSTGCLTCNSTVQFRTQNGTRCPCSIGYWDNNTQICSICHVTCLTCDGATRYDCLTCDNTKFRAKDATQCKCKAVYYQVNVTCYQCHYSCYNCTGGTKYQCVNCNTLVTFRKWNGTSGQCYCMDGYTDIGVTLCQKCDRTCLTCENTSTTCTTCDPLKNRQLTGTSCPCVFGYIDTGNATGFCFKCHYSCLTCSGIASTQCLSCNTVYRTLTTGSCLCLTHTYDNNITQACYPCHQQCQQCTDQYQTTCKQCNATYLRQLVGVFPKPCTCIERYFQNNNALMCDSCHYSCLTCSVVATNCTSCDLVTDFRFLATGSRCLCVTHFYDVGVQSCASCIATCQNCSIFPNNCTTCYSDRYLSGNTCLCNNGTFEDPFQNCVSCYYTCKTCVTSSTFCLSCPIFANRTLNSGACPCDFGFYDNNTVLCVRCPYSCFGCTGPAPAQCIACPAGSQRTLQPNKSCICDIGYYDDGANANCKLCKDTCATCSSFSVCTSCYPVATQNRTLFGGQCKCITGTWDNLVNPVCQLCHFSCASCTGGLSTNCLTCQTNRIFIPASLSCPCMDSFYQASQICYPCDLSCKTCFATSTNCTSCDIVTRFLLNNKCFCRQGYFQNGGTCSLCDISCRTCVTSSTNCLSCNISHLTVLNGSTCVCTPGQYQNPSTLICSACSIKCQTCTGGLQNNCVTCIPTSFRTFNSFNNVCECNPGYYDNGLAACSSCDSSCLTCYGGTSFNCSSCYPGAIKMGSTCRIPVSCVSSFYYEGQCVSICPNTTYPLLNVCATCINNCKTCTSAIICTSCLIGYFYNSTSQTCNVNCPQGCFINRITKTCDVCPIGCDLCAQRNGTVVCQKCSASYYIFNHTSCVDTTFCIVPNYVISGLNCYPCQFPCQTCNNLSFNGCITCRDGYSWYAGECLSVCPPSYYSYLKVCLQCQPRCKQCSQKACQICNTGYYLTPEKINPKCVTISYFYNPVTLLQQKCHPNCYSCTNSSFSSCITCSKFRGDESQMAISGYCDCWEDSIDIGNGNCSFNDYEQLEIYTKTLKSLSDTANYITGISSILSGNFISGGLYLMYQQSYSIFYFVNASAVLQTDQFLQQALDKNLNFYLNSNSTTVPNRPKYSRLLINQLNSRLLVQLQSDQSLFSRGRRYEIYIFDWAIYTVIIIVSIWVAILIANTLLKSQRVNSNQTAKTIFTTIKSITQQSVLIIIHLVTISEISLYATATFKFIIQKMGESGNGQNSFKLNMMKLILSFALVIYYVGYLFRLLVGCCTIGKSPNPEKRNAYNPLKLLIFYFDEQEINSKRSKKQIILNKKPKFAQIPVMKKIYLPMLMTRMALSSVLVIMFSSNPTLQVMSSLGLMVLWTIYSLCFCPYPKFCKIFIHLTELVYVAQISIMLMTVMSNQGSRVSTAYILMILNGCQLGLIILFSILLAAKMIYGFCEQNKSQSKNKINNIYFAQNKHNQSQLDLNDHKKSHDVQIFDLSQKVEDMDLDQNINQQQQQNAHHNSDEDYNQKQNIFNNNNNNKTYDLSRQDISIKSSPKLRKNDGPQNEQQYNEVQLNADNNDYVSKGDTELIGNKKSKNVLNVTSHHNDDENDEEEVIIRKKYRAVRKPKKLQ